MRLHEGASKLQTNRISGWQRRPAIVGLLNRVFHNQVIDGTAMKLLM